MEERKVSSNVSNTGGAGGLIDYQPLTISELNSIRARGNILACDIPLIMGRMHATIDAGFKAIDALLINQKALSSKIIQIENICRGRTNDGQGTVSGGAS